MARPLSEIITHIRAVANDPSISTTLIQTEDLLLLCDAALSPSPAVAAEPVATAENAVYQKITGAGVDALDNRKEQVANPPVRGDREAIAKIIHDQAKRASEFQARATTSIFSGAILAEELRETARTIRKASHSHGETES